MSKRQATRRLILSLCLVLFQVQLFAASALGCLHQRSGAPAHCVHHAQDSTDAAKVLPDGTAATACVKCELTHALHLAAVSGPGLVAAPCRCEPSPIAPRHFYRHAPQPFLRPPIGARA